MNTIDIIALVLTSSLLSAGLTSVVNWYIHKNNYRNDYYKKLLDKRLVAYENVQDLLSFLTGTLQLEDGRLCVFELANGQEHFGKFLTKLFYTIENSVWLSEKTSDLLFQLNLFFLKEIDNVIDENENYDQQLMELGVLYRSKIKQLRFDLQQQLYIDLSSLHKINKFTRPKTRNEGYHVNGKPTPMQKRKQSTQ